MSMRESFITTLFLTMVLLLALAIVGVAAPVADAISMSIQDMIKEVQS